MSTPNRNWTFLFAVPGGHRYFRCSDGRVGVADNSGLTPDDCEDGALFVVTHRPIVILREATLSVVDDDGHERSIMESAFGGTIVAHELGMAIEPRYAAIRKFVRTTEHDWPNNEIIETYDR